MPANGQLERAEHLNSFVRRNRQPPNLADEPRQLVASTGCAQPLPVINVSLDPGVFLEQWQEARKRRRQAVGVLVFLPNNRNAPRKTLHQPRNLIVVPECGEFGTGDPGQFFVVERGKIRASGRQDSHALRKRLEKRLNVSQDRMVRRKGAQEDQRLVEARQRLSIGRARPTQPKQQPPQFGRINLADSPFGGFQTGQQLIEGVSGHGEGDIIDESAWSRFQPGCSGAKPKGARSSKCSFTRNSQGVKVEPGLQRLYVSELSVSGRSCRSMRKV